MAVTLEEFKKSLGTSVGGYTDAELERFNTLCDRLSGALFDAWIKAMKQQAQIDFSGKDARDI